MITTGKNTRLWLNYLLCESYKLFRVLQQHRRTVGALGAMSRV
jgi:hypothetical protein